MLQSIWFQIFLLSSVLSVSFPGSSGQYQRLQQRLMSLSPLCYTILSVLWQGPDICTAFCFLSPSFCRVASTSKSKQWLVIIIIFTPWEFSHQLTLRFFHWSLRDSKFPQICRTLLSILAVFNNVIVWMVYTGPLISRSSSPFNNLLGTVAKAPITISIIVTFMFHSFFNSLARSRYLSFFFFTSVRD